VLQYGLRTSGRDSSRDLIGNGIAKMNRITVAVLAVLIMAASLCSTLGCSNTLGCSTDQASVAELTKAAKHCYILQHAPYNSREFDKYTVTDLQVVSKTTSDLSGYKVTVWIIRAKLYDPGNRYVGDIEETMAKTSLGWVCQ